MRVELLIKGDEAKKRCKGITLPDGVQTRVGTYHADGGDLYFVGFETAGETIEAALKLANVRDEAFNDADARMLEDGASAKFGDNLYPLFSEFERGLREAFSIASCAGSDVFEDKAVKRLDGYTLDKLSGVLFFDHEFRDRAAKLVGDLGLGKEELASAVAELEENTAWDTLFEKDDMPSVRSNFSWIRERRNDVMHCHRMSSATFKKTKALLKKVNGEIATCIERMRTDVDYPKKRAKNAREAVRIIGANDAVAEERMRGLADAYSAMTERYASLSGVAGLSASLADSVNFAGVSATVASLANNGAIASLAANPSLVEAASKMAEDWQERYGKLISAAVTPKMSLVIDQLETGAWQETRRKMLEAMEPALSQAQESAAAMIETASNSFAAGMNYGAFLGSFGGYVASGGDDSGMDESDSSFADDSDVDGER